MTSDFDVAIIGFGPVGATLANLLGLLGLRAVVLEREATIFNQPRAASFDAEAMRAFQTIGLADTIFPTVRAGRHIRHVNTDGKLLLRLERQAGIGPEGWHGAYRFYQPSFESILRDGVGRYPNVDVRLRADTFAIDESPGQLRVRYEDLASGQLRAVTARYVVGCDGARSTVRRFMGTGLQDMRSHERWIVLDMVLECPPEQVRFAADEEGVYADAVQYCDPARPSTSIPMVGKRHRWEFMLQPGDDPATIARPENVWRLLAPWNVTSAEAQIERAAVYTFHSALATSWRRDNLFLAGDAAHQMPPFLGQGLCSGVRDAMNLAWKLGMVIAGKATADLLDTYETERRAHVRDFIELAVKLGEIIQTTDPLKATQRDREMVANPSLLHIIVPPLGPGLHGDAPPPAGTRSAQPLLGDGRRLDDAIGYRFGMLAMPDLVAAASLSNDIAVIPATGSAADYLASLGTRAVVIRPDRNILGTADNRPALDALVARVPGLRQGIAA